MKAQLIASFVLLAGFCYGQSLDFSQFSAQSQVHINELSNTFIYTIGEPINDYSQNTEATIQQGLLHSVLRQTVTEKTTIQIQVFVDDNRNGIKDQDEGYTVQGRIDIQGEELFQIIDMEGIFYYALPGEFTFEYISNNPLYGPTTTFSQTHEVVAGQDYLQVIFGIAPEELKERVSLDFSLEPFRCFRPISNTLTVTNLGSYKVAQTVFLELDSRISSTSIWFAEEPDVVVTDYIVGWNVCLEAGESKSFDYGHRVPGVNSINDVGVRHKTTAWMSLQNSPDEVTTLRQGLRCAYDPNDKLVVPDRPDSLALLEDAIKYTIRFQNTGNDVADDVVVVDTMDTNLDMSTFRVIHSSHPDQLEVVFDHDDEHIVNFRFPGIYLPDSTTNEPGSNGHVTYFIEPKPDLPINTEIENTAHIYFDFNPAIVTNTTGTTLVDSFPPLGEDVYLELTEVICAGEEYEGYSTPGEYVDRFPLGNGFDSIRTLTLYTIFKEQENIAQTICEGESFEGYTKSGVYRDTLPLGDCSYIREIDLTVEQSYEQYVELQTCDGEEIDGFIGSGLIVDKYTTAAGCDSVVIKEIIALETETVAATICEGQAYEGYTSSGTYEDTFQSVSGCDSIRILDLVVEESILESLIVEICNGEEYEGYTTSGIYEDTYRTLTGCDSVRILDLIVEEIFITSLSAEICIGEEYDGYTQTGTYEDQFTAINGCDSIRVLDLLVKPTIETQEYIEICEGQSHNGETEAGIYVYDLVSANNCDSMHILELVVMENATSLFDIEICEGEIYEGYDATGTYEDSFQASNGCDSLRTLQLTVLLPKEAVVAQTLCQGESFEGYNSTGIYTDTFFAANGCDSTRTLELTILSHSEVSEEIFLCPGEQFEEYTEVGSYEERYINQEGCDSIRRIEILAIDRTDPICALRYDDEPKLFSDTEFLNLYPNPARNNIRLLIDKPNRELSELKIFSLQQKLLKTLPIDKRETEVEVSDLSPGLYLFVLQNGRNLFVDRVLIF